MYALACVYVCACMHECVCVCVNVAVPFSFLSLCFLFYKETILALHITRLLYWVSSQPCKSEAFVTLPVWNVSCSNRITMPPICQSVKWHVELSLQVATHRRSHHCHLAGPLTGRWVDASTTSTITRRPLTGVTRWRRRVCHQGGSVLSPRTTVCIIISEYIFFDTKKLFYSFSFCTV